MKYIYTAILFVFLLYGCIEKKQFRPEPHLELGQKITFLGSSPGKTYVIIGYKKNYEGPVEKVWSNQEYIVFLYINDLNDVKQATIHRNSVLKQ